MQIFQPVEENVLPRRRLVAFRPSPDFPQTVEGKVITVTSDGTWLGKHSHQHYEGFFLVAGSCTAQTWTEENGLQVRELAAPIMFMFEPGEEHVLLNCSADMTLVGHMPVTFEQENNTPATHLDC